MHSLARISLCAVLLVVGCGGVTSIDAGAGGAASSSSAATSGSGAGGSCAQASVSFRMLGGGKPGTAFCVGRDCSDVWLSLQSQGQQMVLSSECSVLCDGCMATGCTGACPMPQLLASEGRELVWDGAYFSMTGTCEGGACLETQCASSGMAITATMCAYRQADNATMCTDNPTATCVDVPFQFGVDTEVVGVLDTTK